MTDFGLLKVTGTGASETITIGLSADKTKVEATVDGTVVGSEQITFSGDQEMIPVEFQIEPAVVGRLGLELKIDVPWSCEEGICGSCETRVLEGQVDHRDMVLTPAEQAENKVMMVCVSGCKSERLVLDL